MMSAISAAQSSAEVIILEHKDRIGKKILSTGNGHCNFTNSVQNPTCYRGENSEFPWKVFPQFSLADTMAFFRKLGIYIKNRNGCQYPYSNQASAILDVLRMELERLKVHVETCVKPERIIAENGKFRIITKQHAEKCDESKHQGDISESCQNETKEQTWNADRVILATGSKAAPHTGSDGSGYALAKELGHHLVPVVPALVQLRCKEDFYKSLSGVRLQGRISLLIDGEIIAQDTGEIQMTDYGLSGIPVFQVSRYAAVGIYHHQKVTAILDFIPDMDLKQVLAFLKTRISAFPERKMERFFTGLFHKKMALLLLKRSKIDPQMEAGNLTESQLLQLLKNIKHFHTVIERTNSFDKAQICAGGICTNEVCAETLESKIVPGLYFAGEILDVDGICGGYNLQWAWSSGFVAGREAACYKSAN